GTRNPPCACATERAGASAAVGRDLAIRRGRPSGGRARRFGRQQRGQGQESADEHGQDRVADRQVQASIPAPGRGARLPLVVVCSHRQAPSGWPCRVRRTASADREAGPGSRAGSTPKTPPVPPSGGRAALTARQVQTPAPSPARGGGLGWGPLTASAAVLITPPPRWGRPLPAP